MTNERMARGYFEEGKGRIKTLEYYLRDGRFSTVVREGQECIEILLKSALRLVGIDVPKTHDVGEVLIANCSRFPKVFSENIKMLASISSRLAKKRGISFYGDEESGIPPEELFSQDDAEEAIKMVSFVYDLCEKLMREGGVL